MFARLALNLKTRRNLDAANLKKSEATFWQGTLRTSRIDGWLIATPVQDIARAMAMGTVEAEAEAYIAVHGTPRIYVPGVQGSFAL